MPIHNSCTSETHTGLWTVCSEFSSSVGAHHYLLLLLFIHIATWGSSALAWRGPTTSGRFEVLRSAPQARAGRRSFS